MDYHPLRPNGWKLPEPEPVLEEDQEGQQPITVELVYNTHEECNDKTIALKLSLQLPVKSLGYSHSQ